MVKFLFRIVEKSLEKHYPVQEEVIPLAVAGQKITAIAKNGSGKTAAYTIPTIERLDVKKKYIQSVILVPPREVAL